ncbi:hypothetical protein D3C75_377940 [compost metagenome]
MSTTIYNSYSQKNYYNYENLLNAVKTAAAESTSTSAAKSSNTEAANTEYAEISSLALQYFAQLSDDTDTEATSTGIYSRPPGRQLPPPLNPDQMKSILESIQSKLSASTDASSDDTVSALDSSADGTSLTAEDSTVDSLSKLLSDTDLDSLSDEDIASLFAQVQSVPGSFAYAMPDDQEGNGGPGGIPPMLKAMGAVPPPFMRGANNDAAVDDTSATGEVTQEDDGAAGKLSTDDIKTLLEYLQKAGDADSTGESDDVSGDDQLTAVRSLLSGIDISSASDDELDDLFNRVLQIV